MGKKKVATSLMIDVVCNTFGSSKLFYLFIGLVVTFVRKIDTCS